MAQPVARGLAAAGRAATAGQLEAAMGAQGGAGQGRRRRGRRSTAFAGADAFRHSMLGATVLGYDLSTACVAL
jgi:hypothetical protein